MASPPGACGTISRIVRDGGDDAVSAAAGRAQEAASAAMKRRRGDGVSGSSRSLKRMS